MFTAQRVVELSTQRKQINRIEHSIVKNPNWPEANQLAIYKRGRGFELEDLNSNPGSVQSGTGLRVRRADHSATLLQGKNMEIDMQTWKQLACQFTELFSISVNVGLGFLRKTCKYSVYDENLDEWTGKNAHD